MDCSFSREAAMRMSTAVENTFIIEYMTDAPEGYVKAYLYGLMLCRYAELSGSDAASALGMDDGELTEAFSYWQKLGLVELVNTDPLMVRYLGVFNKAPAGTHMHNKYEDLVNRLNAVFSPRALTGQELMKVYDWIEVYGMDEECAVMLANYCVEATQKENGKSTKSTGRNVGINYMESVARSWTNLGIRDAASAEEHLHEYNVRMERARELTRMAYERTGMNRGVRPADMWSVYRYTQEWFMEPELVLFACDLAKNDTNPFKRVNELVTRWHTDGITTAEAAREALNTKTPDKAQKSTSKSTAFRQRKYTASELSAVGVKLIDED